jgi:hypothetical protein
MVMYFYQIKNIKQIDEILALLSLMHKTFHQTKPGNKNRKKSARSQTNQIELKHNSEEKTQHKQ